MNLFQALISLAQKMGFFRNVGVLATGTAIAQLVLAASLPILTRIYTPDDFSLLAVYASTLGLLSVAACLRFNIAIPLPEDDTVAWHLVVLSLVSGFSIAVVLLAAVSFFPGELAILLAQPLLKPFLWLLPVGVALIAAYDALQYWACRRQQFSLVARTRVTRAVGGVGVQIGLGLAMENPLGLLLGHMLFSGLGAWALILAFRTKDRNIVLGTSFGRTREAAREYKQFPLYSVPEALFNTAGLEISILIIAAVAAGPEAGFLMLAMRILGIPMTLIGNAISQVYLTDAPKKFREGVLESFTRDLFYALIKVGLPLSILIMFLCPMLFPIVFGDEWAPAGVMAVWLLPMFFLSFISSPISAALLVANKLPVAMWLQIFGGVFRIGSVAITAYVAPSNVVNSFAVSGAIFYAICIGVVMAAIRKY